MKLTLSSKNKENQRKMSTANNVTEYTSKITVNIQPMKRYPYCLVWTSVPLITTILPCFCHTGITDSHGTVFDFGYSRYVSRDDLSYGGLKKVVQLFPSDAEKKLWDSSIKKNRSVYRKKEYSFCGENGEMFCASILNMVNYKGKNDYRQYDIWKLNWKYGRYVSKCEIVKTYLGIGVLVVVIIIIIVVTSV